MKNLPQIRLDMHHSWLGLLRAVLRRSAAENPIPEFRDEAARLLGQIDRYAVCYTDQDGKACVKLRLYPTEGAALIWQLLLALSDHYELEPNRAQQDQ